MLNKVIVSLLIICAACTLESKEYKKRPTRVYADIAGDMLHAGHIAFFQKARTFGDILVIGVLSDEDIASYKRKPILSLEERVAMVKACRYVDEVIVAPPLCPDEKWLSEHKFDFVIHGDDLAIDLTNEQYKASIKMGIFHTVPYEQKISTSNIIERIRNRSDEEL